MTNVQLRPRKIASKASPYKFASHLEVRYWLAINGDTVVVSPFPLPSFVKCTPTPQLLVGFETRQEAITLQQILLTAPEDIVNKELVALLQVPYAWRFAPDNPEPPTSGATHWSVISLDPVRRKASTKRKSRKRPLYPPTE